MTDPVTRQEFCSRLIDLCLNSGMTGLPRRSRDRHILLKSVVLTLSTAKEYTERDVNERLQIWLADIGRSIHLDHVSLRRWLVDEGYLERDSRGSTYRVAVPGQGTEFFEPDINDVDVYEAIGVGMKLKQQRKREHAAGGKGP